MAEGLGGMGGGWEGCRGGGRGFRPLRESAKRRVETLEALLYADRGAHIAKYVSAIKVAQ